MAGAVAISPVHPQSGNGGLSYSIVIPSLGNPVPLRETLGGIAAQSRLPELVIVVDPTGNDEVKEVLCAFENQFRVSYQQATEASGAMQRNQGALRVTTPIVGFIDDNVRLFRDTCDRLCTVFDHDLERRVGGVSARCESYLRSPPNGLIWWYYRIQAGYAHPTYGGKVIGAALNCYPTYVELEREGDLIPADWLASKCVFYRTSLFHEEMFPNFRGYGLMEDVHLSARIGRRSRTYFHALAKFHIEDGIRLPEANVRETAQGRLRNQRLVAEEILGMSGLELEAKFFLHRLFESISIFSRRAPGWREELYGTWL